MVSSVILQRCSQEDSHLQEVLRRVPVAVGLLHAQAADLQGPGSHGVQHGDDGGHGKHVYHWVGAGPKKEGQPRPLCALQALRPHTLVEQLQKTPPDLRLFQRQRALLRVSELPGENLKPSYKISCCPFTYKGIK